LEIWKAREQRGALNFWTARVWRQGQGGKSSCCSNVDRPGALPSKPHKSTAHLHNPPLLIIPVHYGTATSPHHSKAAATAAAAKSVWSEAQAPQPTQAQQQLSHSKMGLARGAFKIGFGFTATYAIVWGNWGWLSEKYNARW